MLCASNVLIMYAVPQFLQLNIRKKFFEFFAKNISCFFSFFALFLYVTKTARLAGHLTIRGSNPVRGKIFFSLAHPASYSVAAGVIFRGKAAGA
jgi:hypothetical protein